MISSDDSEDTTASLYFLFFASLLALVLLLSRALHSRPKLNSVLSEPAMVLLVGMFFSFLVSFWFEDILEEAAAQEQQQQQQQQKEEGHLTQTILSFPNKVFFLALLPPILFNSGYQLQRELFFRHIKPISLFAALGTTISGLATGLLLYAFKNLGWFGAFDPTFLELCTFGALIAATDTVSVLGVLQAKRVDPHLFSLVFGESALNDAVAIVLFRSFASMLEDDVGQIDSVFDAILQILFDFLYQAVGSPCFGIVFAFAIALLFKYADLRETKMLELSLFILLMYFPFVMAEEIHLSGIVSIFFAGLSARRYIEPNVSDETKRNAEVLFHLIAYLAETCIFLELGLSVFGLSSSFQWGFIGLAFIAALFGRAMSVYPISMAFNFSLEETEPLLEKDDDASVGSDSSHSSSSWSSGRQRRRRVVPERRSDKRIPFSFMHILWFAGLRGAVAYSCARDFPNLYGHRDEFTACTMVIVFVTIVIMGGCTETLLDHLNITMNVDEKEYMKAWRRRRRLKGFFHEFGTWGDQK
jgi:solute carrier family 9 (sodium/hydrogen exchanger), member 8